MTTLMLLGLCSQSVAHAESWSRDNTTRETIYLTLHVVDWVKPVTLFNVMTSLKPTPYSVLIRQPHMKFIEKLIN